MYLRVFLTEAVTGIFFLVVCRGLFYFFETEKNNTFAPTSTQRVKHFLRLKIRV